MNRQLINQPYLMGRRNTVRFQEPHPTTMTNFRNLSMTDTELVGNKLLDGDNSGGYFANKSSMSSAVPFNNVMMNVRQGREGSAFGRERFERMR